jgi:NADH:ubiquinone oxidoreductase subunit 4 (subunit M)
LLGALIVACSAFRYFDLKKIIALSSIIHLNVSFLSCLSFNASGVLGSIFISLSHSFSSVGLFLFAGLLISKSYSRYVDCIFWLGPALRFVFVLFVLSNINIPGSINFIGELLALISITAVDASSLAIVLFLSFAQCLNWLVIVNRKLPCCCVYSICVNALLVMLWLLLLIFSLGFPFVLRWFLMLWLFGWSQRS